MMAVIRCSLALEPLVLHQARSSRAGRCTPANEGSEALSPLREDNEHAGEGLSVASARGVASKSPSSFWRKVGVTCAVLAAVFTFFVVLASLSAPRSPLSLHVAPFGFSHPTISGNRTVGWTYSLRVNAGPGSDRPTSVAWRNFSFELMNETNGGPLATYTIPPGTMLHMFSSSGSEIARYNLSAVSWETGTLAPIADGQTLVLQGMIPPGTNAIVGSQSSFTGPSLVIRYSNSGNTFTTYVPLGV